MDEEQLVAWILRYLGAPFVKVELTAEHITDAIEEARRWYTAKKGLHKLLFFDVVSGVSVYTLPPDVEVVVNVAFASTGIATITSVASAGIGPGFGGVDIYGGLVMAGSGGIVPSFSPFGSVTGPLSEWTQSMQYLEQFARVFSSELDWRQDHRELRLFPPSGYPTGLVCLEYKTNTFTIEQLSDRDHDLVKRYSLMASKKRLGRVRSKYPGGFPTAQGSVDLDGATLLEEARSEEETLTTEIYEHGWPMGFFLG
jgi:hypothetical protein